MRRTIVASVALLLACNRSPTGGDGGDDDPGTSEGGSVEGESMDDSDPEVCGQYPEGDTLYQCGEDCARLSGSAKHCGACFNVCENEFTKTSCRQGQCQGFYGECVYPDGPFNNCAQYCSSIGKSCDAAQESGACGPTYEAHFGILPEACEGIGRTATTLVTDVGCHDPIDWTQFDGLGIEPMRGVQCCCSLH